MIHITDFDGDIVDFISKSDGAVTEAEHMINVEDKLETFDFTVLTSRTEHMQKRNRVIIEDKDGQYREFIIYNISSDLNGYTRVQTNASALEDIKTAKPVGPHKLDKHTVKQALEYVLADTGWEVSDEAEWGGTRTTSWTGWHDRISILKQLETTYDMRLSFHVEVGSNKITNRYVSLNKVEPMFEGEEIVYGENMIDLKRTVDFSDIATALICLGPEDNETGKREIVEVKDDDAQAQFGLPYRYIWDIYEPQSNDEDMTKERLTTLGRTALNKRKQESISYDIDGIGLSASAGDMIRVKNEDFTPELYVDAEVVEVTTDLISGESEYKFGVIKEYTRDDVYARFNAMLSGLRERLNKVVENTDSIISERLEEELKYVERYIEKSPTPPLNAKEGQLWLDTSHDGVAVLKRYENGEWIKSSVSDVKEIGGMTREETMYEALKERSARNAVDYSEVFKRHGALVSEKHYHYVDEDIKNDLSSRYNTLQQSYDDFKQAFNNINAEQPTIGLITTAISRAVEFEARLKEYNDSYYVARKSFDEVIALLQSQYSEEKFNEAMKEVANSIGGTFDGEKIVADIPNQEDLKALNEDIKQYLNGEIDSLDGKLGKQIETVVNQAKDEFSVAIDSVEKKVDGIEIGGRNLIPNSKNGVMLHPNNTRINNSYIETTYEYKTVYNDEEASILSTYTPVLLELPAGTYTDSVDVWSPVEINLSVGNGEKANIKPNEWTRISETREHDGGTYRVLGLYSDKEQNAINGVRYRNYKTEKGTIATDWTPAPEDVDNAISNLTQEVTKNTTSLNVLENEISLKADSSTVKQMLDNELNAVKSNVQTNQSELKLLSNQISSKVEKSEYTTDMNGITRDINNTKSEINQLSDSVNSKITSVEQKFDDLEIGGRNLLLNSSLDNLRTWFNADNQEIVNDVYGRYIKLINDNGVYVRPTEVEENTPYTFSFYAKAFSDNATMRIGFLNQSGMAKTISLTNEWKRYVVVFDSTLDLSKKTYFHIYRNNNIVGFLKPKLEKGNKPTDWTPAPEDYQTQIDSQGNTLTKHENEIEQNKLGIGTKVSYTEMNGTQKTLEKLLTEFSQTSSGFNFRIDSNGMIQDLTFDRNAFKLNSNLIEFNDGDVVIKDGVTTIKDAYIDKLFSKTAFVENLKAVDIDFNKATARAENGSDYINITGSRLELGGRYSWNWRGGTKNYNSNIVFENGYMRVTDRDINQHLYYTQKGISTFNDGNINESSGTLEFFSYDYHDIRKGVTLSSTGGAVALRSSLERAIIDAHDDVYLMSEKQRVKVQPRKELSGNNTFEFHIVGNEGVALQDGIIYYGSENNPYSSVGLRFSKELDKNTIYVTNGSGRRGTGDLEVRKLRVNENIIGTVNLDHINTGDIIFGSLRTANTSTNTYIGVGSAELRITNNQMYNGGNTVYRPIRASAFNQGSSLFYKTNIKNIENIGLSVIRDLTVVEYDLIDDINNGIENRKQLGFIAEYSESIATIDNKAIDIYRLSAYNTKAIQELAHENDELKKRIEKLEELING